MKVKINCPKCGAENIKITSDGNDPTPLYKCGSCGYKHRLFPEFESDKNQAEEADEE